MAFPLENSERNIILTEEDEEDFKNKYNCRFCETKIEADKITDHCHLTGN